MATVHLTEMADYDGMNQVWMPGCSRAAPCRACVRLPASQIRAGWRSRERGALAPDHRKTFERAGRHSVAAPPVHSHKLCKALIFSVLHRTALECAVPSGLDQVSAMTQRLREIPYNHTSYSDREIVIRQLGSEVWQIVDELRQERVTGRSARMLYEVLGDIWVVQRNPYLQDDLLDGPRPSRGAGRRAVAPPGGNREAPPGIGCRRSRARGQGRRGQGRLRGGGRFRAPLRRRAAARSQRALLATPAGRQHLLDGHARVSHVTDATDWRVEYPFVVLTRTPRTRWRCW